MGVVAPNAGAPAVTRAARPVFHPPVLVSDSPFNSYADGYFSLPRPHGSGTRGQVLFGIGAGRFTQSTNQGNSWVALPKWNREAADLNGYNPALPFFGPTFGIITPAGTLRDWGHINYGDQGGVAAAQHQLRCFQWARGE